MFIENRMSTHDLVIWKVHYADFGMFSRICFVPLSDEQKIPSLVIEHSPKVFDLAQL